MSIESVIKKQSKEKIKITLIVLTVITIVFIALLLFMRSLSMWANWYSIIILTIYLPFICQLIKAFLWYNNKDVGSIIKQLKKYGLHSIKVIENDIKNNARIKYCSPAYDIAIFASSTWFILTTKRQKLLIRKTEEIKKISKTYQHRYGSRYEDGYFTIDILFDDGKKNHTVCLWQYIDNIIKEFKSNFPNIECEKDAVNNYFFSPNKR